MPKVDFKKTIPSYKARVGKFSIIDVPPLQYLMIDGDKGPASTDYMDAIKALYPVAYKLKFMSKQVLEKDYVVPPLEALWWAEDWSVFTTNFDQSQWLWTAMILVPDWITKKMLQEVIAAISAKDKPTSLDKLRLAELDEGKCVQTLHLGSFDSEGPVLKDMHDNFVPDNGFDLQGKHHEIYFSDFRKTAPERLRTILRQPVKST